MKLFNNTANEVFYGISAPGMGDCGTIAPGGTSDVSSYDNTANVRVTFQPTPGGPNQATPFVVNISETETGKAVTIGLYQE